MNPKAANPLSISSLPKAYKPAFWLVNSRLGAGLSLLKYKMRRFTPCSSRPGTRETNDLGAGACRSPNKREGKKAMNPLKARIVVGTAMAARTAALDEWYAGGGKSNLCSIVKKAFSLAGER